MWLPSLTILLSKLFYLNVKTLLWSKCFRVKAYQNPSTISMALPSPTLAHLSLKKLYMSMSMSVTDDKLWSVRHQSCWPTLNLIADAAIHWTCCKGEMEMSSIKIFCYHAFKILTGICLAWFLFGIIPLALSIRLDNDHLQCLYKSNWSNRPANMCHLKIIQLKISTQEQRNIFLKDHLSMWLNIASIDWQWIWGVSDKSFSSPYLETPGVEPRPSVWKTCAIIPNMAQAENLCS